MRKIRYLTMMVMWLVCHITIWAQGTFDPASPAEPGMPELKYRVTLVATPSVGGSVSGAGTYIEGRNVTVTASANTGYTFKSWTNENGDVLTQNRSYTFVKAPRHETLFANFEFTPSSPTEPSNPNTTLYYQLSVVGDDGCTVSGGGRYLYQKSISVSASLQTGYVFVNWTNQNGEVVSTSRSFTYTKQDKAETLYAHTKFDPSSPSEPGNPVLKHWVRATCTDGGTISGSVNQRVLTGNSYSLRATVNTGYEFVGWYRDGEFYSGLASFSGTMGNEDVEYHAVFRFNPLSPTEPAMPALSMYSFYLPSVNGTPGSTVKYAINLVNTEIVGDMNIRLTFPAGVEISPQDYVLSDKAIGYGINIAEAVDDISIIEEGARLWDFTLIGGSTKPATQSLLTFDVIIPETIETGYSHAVKINQISMTMSDGTSVTARTRNGRIGVYKMGDVNGDDEVNITDVVGTLKLIKKEKDDSLLMEMANPNNDEEINITDVVGILEIIKEEKQ